MERRIGLQARYALEENGKWVLIYRQGEGPQRQHILHVFIVTNKTQKF